jgi:hypothetical protein
MSRSTRPRFPGDVFNINDHVKCTNPRSKHYGHTGYVTGMGKTRLNVTFDNGHIGTYLDWRDAALHATDDEHNVTPRITTTLVHQEGDDVAHLTGLLEHMAFTAASIISSSHDDSPRMEQLLTSFERSVRTHAVTLSTSRRHSQSSSRPTPTRIFPDDI